MALRIEREDDAIWLSAPPFMKDRVKQIPGARHDARRQAWRFPLSWAVCVIARGVFGAELEVGPELISWASEEKNRMNEVMAARVEATEF